MEASAFPKGRGRGAIVHDGRGRPLSRNKHWSVINESRSQSHTPNNADGERWERGGHRGRGRGHSRGIVPKYSNLSLRLDNTREQQHTPQEAMESIYVDVDEGQGTWYAEDTPNRDHDVADEEEDESEHVIEEPELETQEERDKFYQDLVKAREVEKKKAIAEGKMDDPLVPKRLEDAITIVGTCLDMCPRFERYRRERENNLFEWEMIPGTKRVDHNRAVKMYERGAGDRILPSDLRPPSVLKRTLDYLFHDLLPRGGFSPTFNFIRDRSRAVRNDFTMQHITAPLAMECYDRCARFHILALHLQRDDHNFSIPLEEQQLMNTLQSLKEFYEDQRGKYQSPTELEMRVYHRLIHIRDQKERHDDIPEHIHSHPVFKLTTEFRLHVQKHSAPIRKTSKLVVTDEGMRIFSNLAAVLIEQGNTVMVYLVACILERLFGKDTIEDMESLRGKLTIQEVIDGISIPLHQAVDVEFEQEDDDNANFLGEPQIWLDAESLSEPRTPPIAPTPVKATPPQWLSNDFPGLSALTAPTAASATSTGNAFTGLVSQSNASGTTNVFGNSIFSVFPSKPVSSDGLTSSSQRISGTITSVAQPSGEQISPPQPSNPFTSTATVITPSQSPPLVTTSTNIFGANKAPAVETSRPDVAQQLPRIAGAPSPTSTSNSPLPFSLNPNAPRFTPPKIPTPFAFPQPSSFPFPTGSSTSGTPLPPAAGPVTDTKHTTPLTAVTKPPTILFSTEPAAPSPPSLNRLVAPPLLRIDTNTSSGSSSNPSPALPPAPKLQPVSLPATPSAVPPNPLATHLRIALEPRGSLFSTSSKEILSPLGFGSLSTTNGKTLQNFTPLSTPQSSRIFQPPLLNTSNKGKEKTPDRSMYDDAEVIEMEKKALSFSRKGLLVRNSFARWLKRAIDRATWHEACRHGDEYRQRINSQSRDSSVFRSSSRSVSPLEKKQINGVVLSPHKKRTRKRISADYRRPRTDEDLAKRFKENLQEHEQRWSQGSLLKVIRNHIQGVSPATSQLPWDIWLSLNPESDATAIWLERKFNMPNSGSWVSESIFTIPLSSSKALRPPGFPGLIVFECTPVGDVVDELEKKYRALDDCSRLKDVIATLHPKRHFVPSLLVIHWAEDDSSLSSDFLSMAKQLESESMIQFFQVFSMTTGTNDLDCRLRNSLTSMHLDMEGKLVKSLNSKGLFKAFEPTSSSFFNEWIESSKRGYCKWNLYGEIIKAAVSILDTISHLVHSLLEISTSLQPYPEFIPGQMNDSSSTYDSVFEWLSNFGSKDDTRMVAMDLQSHRNIGQDFPLSVFIDLLYCLVQIRIERLDPSSHPILISDLDSALGSLKEGIQPHHLRLLQIYNLSARRSPKRRTYSVASSGQSSPEAKRPRLLSPVASSTHGEDLTPKLSGNGLPSPTPSAGSLAPSDAPTVTVSMLRALTKDLRKKYITS